MTTEQRCFHIVGSARTIATAVLCVEYLRARLANPQSEIRADQIGYRFKEPTDKNGWWSSDIGVTTYSESHAYSLPEPLGSRFVEVCRAFVAGRGEIW
jgi:hypothetical protein